MLAATAVALDGCNLADTSPIPYLSINTRVAPLVGPEQGLTGTLVLVPAHGPLPPNTIFDFTITAVRLTSYGIEGSTYTVDGNTGRISATTLSPSAPLTARATVTINGVLADLEGSGSSDTFTDAPHPRFTELTLSGGGYRLTISAIPEL